MVTREDVELELERLHRGWLAPRASFEAQAVLRVLDELAADACFPIFAHEELYGFLAVGDAARKNPYAKSELSEFFNLSQKIGAVFTSLDRQNRMRRQEHLAALGQLAAGLAHEIRNPLGAIWGAVQVLESPQAREMNEDERADFFRIVAQEVHRMNRVVLDFLEYARPATDRSEPIDLRETCERMMPLLSTTAAPVVVQLETSEDSLVVSMDPDKLRQILLNLVLNAKDALEAVPPSDDTKPSAAIRLRVSRRATEAIVEVVDAGCGIPAEQLARVFDPFFTTKDRGTGLGLPICARLMESAGGALTITSDASGTTCTLSWPAQKNSSAA